MIRTRSVSDVPDLQSGAIPPSLPLSHMVGVTGFEPVLSPDPKSGGYSLCPTPRNSYSIVDKSLLFPLECGWIEIREFNSKRVHSNSSTKKVVG